MRDDPFSGQGDPLDNCATCRKPLDPDGLKDDGFFCSKQCEDVYRKDQAARDNYYIEEVKAAELLAKLFDPKRA